MPQSSPQALLIFIKNAKKGNVKTRLAATLGDEEALSVYKKLLDYTREAVAPLEVDKQLWYSRFVPKNDNWDANIFNKKVQEGESLGQRMQQAFKQSFEEGYERSVIIGSDCAQLNPDHLEQAYQALLTNDVVIGPSQDGGYYLLGMRRYLPVLFEDKSWSTKDVFDQTIADCKKHGFSCHVLEELNDVDTETDWNQVKDKF